MKILVVDDHALIRDALRGVLKQVKRGAVLLEAPDSRKAMDIVEAQSDIGLVLLDLTLPDRDGFSVLAELRERFPGIAIVVLSALQDRANVRRALDLGVAGYIPKSARREVMLSALRLVLAGGVYIPPEILVGEGSRPLNSAVPPSETSRPAGRPVISPADVGLSDRQLEVLALLMQGKNNKIICRTLHLAEPTVKNHVTAILRALKVTNRTEAVITANELGWKLTAVAKT